MDNINCYNNDHDWHGTSMCVHCGARLRCECGVFVREDNLDEHLTPERCRFIASLPEDDEGVN